MLSPDPEAKRSVAGFHAQMKTSLSCPRNTVALDAGISMQESVSMGLSVVEAGFVVVVVVVVNEEVVVAVVVVDTSSPFVSVFSVLLTIFVEIKLF